jgi:DNA-binding MarR family transcriptional regulator
MKAIRSVTDRVGYLLKQAQHGLRAKMDQDLKVLGVSTAQYAILAALQEANVASGAELARRCFVTPQTITALIAGLDQARLIDRAPSRHHGRIIEARLTDAGQIVVRRAHAIVKAIEDDMLADLSERDRTALARILKSCVNRLSERSEAFT